MMRSFQPFQSRNPVYSLLNHHSFWVSRFGLYRSCELKKRGRNLLPNRAVERDSDFEFDPDKAREALRKLDRQFDLISNKQANPVPKIKASSPYTARDEATKDLPDTASFLPFAFFGLLIFTIFYNIIFIKIIKPSIDGEQVELAPARSSIMRDILKAELLTTPEVPVQP